MFDVYQMKTRTFSIFFLTEGFVEIFLTSCYIRRKYSSPIGFNANHYKQYFKSKKQFQKLYDESCFIVL